MPCHATPISPPFGSWDSSVRKEGGEKGEEKMPFLSDMKLDHGCAIDDTSRRRHGVRSGGGAICSFSGLRRPWDGLQALVVAGSSYESLVCA